MSDLFGHAPSPTIDLEDGEYLLVLHLPGNLAIKVSESGDAAKAVWLPRSQIEFSETGQFCQHQVGARKLPIIKVRIPEWLAKEKGLI